MLQTNTVLLLGIIALVLMASGVSTTTQNEYPVKYSNPWDESPITVYIDNKNVPSHYKSTYYEQVKKSLEYWEQGGNGHLGFTPEFKLVDSKNPDIRIGWVKHLDDENINENTAVVSELDTSGNSISNSEILLEVGSYRYRMWNQYSDQTMFILSRHALGRSLGLKYSNDKLDIMHLQYKKDSGFKSLLMDKKDDLLNLGTIAAILLNFSLILMVVYNLVSWNNLKKER